MRKRLIHHKSEVKTIRNFEQPVDSRTAAAFLGIHYKTLERMARKGEVPATKLGKSWQFRLSVLSKWFDAQLNSNVARHPATTNQKEEGD
jgi:excisionase family DNA binding protein